MSIARSINTLSLAPTLAFAGFLAVSGPAGAVDVQKVTSPGGIQAWLVEEHTVPVVALNFAFSGGASQDPDGKSGLANFMSSLLDEGAEDLDSTAFQKALEETQARIGFSVGRDFFYGDMRTLSFLADESFELLRKAVTAPRFDSEPIDRMRRQVISGLKRDETDPDALASQALFATLFPDHPYGNRRSGTIEHIEAITRDDLVAHHRAIFAKEHLKVAVVGAISAEKLAPLLDQVFGDLPETANLKAIPEIVPQTDQAIATPLEVPQSAIRMALPSIKRSDPDFLAAFVMNHILGGGSFTSRLYSEVREKRGFVYSVYSRLVPYNRSALFFVGAGSRSETADDTVDLIIQEIKRMGEEGPTPEEFEKAKKFLTGSYALRFDTSNKIAGQLLGLQLNDLPADYINTRNDQINALELDDIKRIANKILAEAVPTVVVVGQPGS
ncbi:MAG: pitrilysin family protein [Pseudomonadota bacterium]